MNGKMTFWEHFDELRVALIKVLSCIILGALISLAFYQPLFHLLTSPITNLEAKGAFSEQTIRHIRIHNQGKIEQAYTLPKEAYLASPLSDSIHEIKEGVYLIPPGKAIEIAYSVQEPKLVVLGPIEGTLLTLKVSFWCGLIGSSPAWLWFLCQFIGPALTRDMKYLLLPFMALSIIFLFAGFIFAYYLTIPLANQFLFNFNAELGTNFWSLSQYISYTLVLLLAHGLVFELFIVLLFLIHLGILQADSLSKKRRHAILGAFILGAIFTPPDVFTQVLMALSLICFYELGILYAKLIAKKEMRLIKKAVD